MTQNNKGSTTTEDFGKWSLTQLAKEFQVARETVAKRLLSGNVKSSGKRNGHAVYRVSKAAEAILFPIQNKPGVGNHLDDLSPKNRLDYYRAENEKVKLGKEKKLLVEADDARTEMATIAKSGLYILETLRDTLERDFDLSQEILDSVEAKVNVLRNQWAEMKLVENNTDSV